MKRFLLLLSLVLLVACGSAETADPTPTTSPPTATPLPPTATPVPPTATPEPTPTSEYAGLSEEEQSEALFEAARKADLTIMAELIAIGVDINQAEPRAGLTPLSIMVRKDNIEGVQMLLDAGADATIFDNGDNTLLHHAASANSVAVAELLLASDQIELEHRRDTYGFTALLLAAFDGHPEMVELLVANGANIEAFDDWEDTPVNVAAWNGKAETVEKLVELGANPDWSNEQGNSALDHSRSQGHEEIESFLLTVIDE